MEVLTDKENFIIIFNSMYFHKLMIFKISFELHDISGIVFSPHLQYLIKWTNKTLSKHISF